MVNVVPLTQEEKERLLKALREDAAFREEVRRLLLEEMQASMQRLQESIQELVALRERDAALMREGFEALRQSVQELSQQVQENSRQIAKLTERMERVEAQIARLTGEVQKQGERLDDVSGVAAEAGGYREITLWLRSRQVEITAEYLPGDLQDLLNVSPVPDGVMLIKSDSGYVFLVYEITFRPAIRDVRRIAEWLEGFRKVNWPAVGLVYFRRALPEEDVEQEIYENGREIIHLVPGMRTLREKAAEHGVLLMQHGASPWRPAGWRLPETLKEIPPLPTQRL